MRAATVPQIDVQTCVLFASQLPIHVAARHWTITPNQRHASTLHTPSPPHVAWRFVHNVILQVSANETLPCHLLQTQHVPTISSPRSAALRFPRDVRGSTIFQIFVDFV
ncbi:hypothetical protein Scep_014343 [Stephania cephalantha]|uniref:Uncharacterized protein n=1 Tax=Stephania cephalantha TaxID=152367 RepID=A0AAP0NZB1_9MAGN